MSPQVVKLLLEAWMCPETSHEKNCCDLPSVPHLTKCLQFPKQRGPTSAGVLTDKIEAATIPSPPPWLPWMNKAEELQTFETSAPHMHVRHRATIFQAGILFGLPHCSCRVCHAIGSFFLWNQTHSTRNDPLLHPSLITDLALVMMLHWIIS